MRIQRTDPTLATGTTTIKSAHQVELRNAVDSVIGHSAAA